MEQPHDTSDTFERVSTFGGGHDVVKAKTYLAKEFAKILGISKSHLLKLEGDGKLPPARRVQRGKVMHRFYTVEDIPVYRDKLDMPPLLTKRRTQLFLNFKGGTGKSSLSAAWAYQLAELGLRVLAIDLDPQSHLTKCLGVAAALDKHKSLFDVLIEDVDINAAITTTSMPNLDLVPATLKMSVIESRLLNMDMREFLLKAALERLETNYQVIVIDALPTITLLNKNAVLASDDLMIPVLADYLSFDGLGLLFYELTKLQHSFSIYHPQGGSQELFDNIHIIVNQYNPKLQIAQQCLTALRKHYSTYLCETLIPDNTKVTQATAAGMPVTQFDPSCTAAKRIRALIEEVYGF